MKKIFGKTVSYFKESWVELGKVVWPTRKQVLEMTVAVIALSTVVALLLGVFDYGLQQGLNKLLSLWN